MTGYEIYKEANKLNLSKGEFKKLLIKKNIIIPKNMWIRMTNEKPKHHGAYIVFGRINIGTPFESREKFTAFWAGEFGWTDKDGDDYNQLNEGIEFWLNISYIQNPE